MPRFTPAAVSLGLLALLAGCPAPGLPGAAGSPGPGACPPVTRDVPANAQFTLVLTEADDVPREGLAVKVTRTPRLPKVACPGKLRDEATATTDADGEAAFINMAAGTYAVAAEGLAGVEVEFEAKAPMTFAIGPDGKVAAKRTEPATRLQARWLDRYQFARPGLPEAGQASFTIADAAAARAFAAWVQDPDPALAGTDFAKERLVALYRQLPRPGCNANVVFDQTPNVVQFSVETRELPKGMNCAPAAVPASPFWAVAVLPADPVPVLETTALAADATWLTASPSPSTAPAPSTAP